MALPPAPAKQSMITFFSLGAVETSSAIFLSHVSADSIWKPGKRQIAKRTYFATGSGVTPNHASSVIQIPSSYLEKMSYLWCQYFEISKGTCSPSS